MARFKMNRAWQPGSLTYFFVMTLLGVILAVGLIAQPPQGRQGDDPTFAEQVTSATALKLQLTAALNKGKSVTTSAKTVEDLVGLAAVIGKGAGPDSAGDAISIYSNSLLARQPYSYLATPPSQTTPEFEAMRKELLLDALISMTENYAELIRDERGLAGSGDAVSICSHNLTARAPFNLLT